MEKIDILSLNLCELEEEILAMGEKKFRAKQIYEWLHKKKATELGINPATAKRYISDYWKKYKVAEFVTHGHYRKTNLKK